MATRWFCDMCGKELPLAGSLQTVELNARGVGEVCLDCSNKLENAIRTARVEVMKTKKELPKPEELPAEAS